MLRLLVILTFILFGARVSANDKCPAELGESAPTEAATPSAHLHTDLKSYIDAMEKSSLQKAAFAAQARPGRIVDLGSGSGISARDLALLFPDSKIEGVDLDPHMTEHAAGAYPLPNLSFRTGNAETKVYRDNSLDTVFSSSTGHHLTSYGTGSFDITHVKNAMHSVYAQLKDGGLFILRDFVVPRGPGQVLIDLRSDDGQPEGSTVSLSTSALFKKFCHDFRSSQHPDGPAVYSIVSSDGKWDRYQVSYRDAVEFILHKDYREHYDAEIKEEYTYMTQDQFEQSMREAGFRVLHSAYIYNGWIIENRFKGKFRLFDLNKQPLPMPPTNFAIVGQKVKPTEGATLRVVSSVPVQAPQYLRVQAMRDRKTGEIFDVVERPNETVDVLPYFSKSGRVYVYGKQSFPRPILSTIREQDRLTGVRDDGYVMEPISFIRSAAEPSFQEIERQLEMRTGIRANEILRGPGFRYKMYTSPGIANEQVETVAIQIRSRRITLAAPAENYSGLSTSGVVRPLEATQILRSSQVAASLDSRLEAGVYNLLLDLKQSVGPWIGDEILLKEQSPRAFKVVSFDQVLSANNGERRFETVEPNRFGQFLEVRSGTFEEVSGEGKIIAQTTREYVVPKNLGISVASAFPVARVNGEIYLGLERRHLPTVQINEGSSGLIAAPAWRLPKEITNFDQAVEFMSTRLNENFGLKAIQVQPLGSSYHPTPGLTPETKYPMMVEVDAETIGKSKLEWVLLKDLINHRAQIKDGQLLVGALRLAHALGLLW